MMNPFLRRATEYLRDEEAFLALVSPEPLAYFLKEHGATGRLYDRLVIIRGTPGSGKTTLARLFESPSIAALLRNSSVEGFRQLVAAMTEAKAIHDEVPAVAGCRIALETDYREFWEFPYPEELKTGLMKALLQARAVLTWIRNLCACGYAIGDIEIVPRPDANAAVAAIGGTSGTTLLARARDIEASLYKVISQLIAPPVDSLDPNATSGYRPFDVIDRFRIAASPATSTTTLKVLKKA